MFQPGIGGLEVMAFGLVVGDFNGDGRADIASIGPFGRHTYVSVALGNGDGTFQSPMMTETDASTNSLAEADFNGDGKTDLAFGTLTGVAVLPGNGNGTFDRPISSASRELISIAVSNFNGDGKADIIGLVVTSGEDYEVAVLLGEGGGGFQAPAYSAPITGDRYGPFLADFNGDGRVDAAEDTAASPVTVELGTSKAGDGSTNPLP